MKRTRPFADALAAAERLVAALIPACTRIMIAGSIRREKPEIGDIEIVAIPIVDDLDLGAFDRYLASVGVHPDPTLKAWGDRYKKATWEGMQADLFLQTPETWGVNAFIRTGCAEFVHWCVTPRLSGGRLPSGLRVADARIWRRISAEPEEWEALPTPEEQDVFDLLELPWIEPRERVEGWRR